MERAMTAPMIGVKMPPVSDETTLDRMTEERFAAEIERRYQSYKEGRYKDAKAVFAEFLRTH